MARNPLSAFAILAATWMSVSIPGAAGNPADILASLKVKHPRLLISDTTWDSLKARRREDRALDELLVHCEREARALIAAPPVVYLKEGKRLLAVSRTVFGRVLLLAMEFHLSGDKEFARRAQEEMLAAAAFDDWNPSHFLDVAEMTAGIAIGYDWLYDDLDSEARKSIEKAIVEKGVRSGLPNMGWAKMESNWNQVCLSGMTLGALAVAEDEPALAAQTLEKTRVYNSNGLKPYAPSGVYPEGGTYWGYGTTYQVLLLSALESSLGTDWGLGQSQGFMQTADAHLQTIGPTGKSFNFADGSENLGVQPAMFWFARKLKRTELLKFTMRELDSAFEKGAPRGEEGRFLPLAAIWWPAGPIDDKVTLPKAWLGRGITPVAAFRSSWSDPQAMYLALKGGRANSSHSDMNAGSFVFESDGVRWARDLDKQDYYSLEAKHISLFDSKQDGGRWKVFRLNNFSHNVLTINNQLHRADGAAAITHFSDGADEGAIVDLTPVFNGQASRVTRGFAFRSGSHVLVRDEIEGLKPGGGVRWALLTSAEISISADGSQAVLRQDGKEMRAGLVSSVAARFEIGSAQPPENGYDAPNPGVRFLKIELAAPASGELSCSVTLQPGSVKEDSRGDQLIETPLAKWPQPAVDK